MLFLFLFHYSRWRLYNFSKRLDLRKSSEDAVVRCTLKISASVVRAIMLPFRLFKLNAELDRWKTFDRAYIANHSFLMKQLECLHGNFTA